MFFGNNFSCLLHFLFHSSGPSLSFKSFLSESGKGNDFLQDEDLGRVGKGTSLVIFTFYFFILIALEDCKWLCFDIRATFMVSTCCEM